MSTLTTTAKMKIFKTQYSEEYNRIDPDQKLSNKELMKNICSIIEQSKVDHMGIDMSGFQGILSQIKNSSLCKNSSLSDQWFLDDEEKIHYLTDFLDKTPEPTLNSIIIDTYQKGILNNQWKDHGSKKAKNEVLRGNYNLNKDQSVYPRKSLSEIIINSLDS